MPKVALLITILDCDVSYDDCLLECQKQVEALQAEGRYSFSLYLNNEGVEGYQSVWKKASEEEADLYFWIDHDVLLSEGALASFLENSEFLRHKAVIAGTVSRPDRSLLFGGRSRRGRLVEPDPVIPVPCHLYDMALVLVPAYAFSRLETPADFFRPSLFYDGYGSRVAEAGIARVVAPGIMATTVRKADVADWRSPGYSKSRRAVLFLKRAFGKLRRTNGQI